MYKWTGKHVSQRVFLLLHLCTFLRASVATSRIQTVRFSRTSVSRFKRVAMAVFKGKTEGSTAINIYPKIFGEFQNCKELLIRSVICNRLAAISRSSNCNSSTRLLRALNHFASYNMPFESFSSRFLTCRKCCIFAKHKQSRTDCFLTPLKHSSRNLKFPVSQTPNFRVC